jgi:hypothetical protein
MDVFFPEPQDLAAGEIKAAPALGVFIGRLRAYRKDFCHLLGG